MILTGATATLVFDTIRVGKCRQISLEVDREALPTTKQGDIDRTFISGLRDTKGSASLFYDPTDPAVDALMTRVFTDSGTLSGLDLVFDTHTDEKVSVSVVLTNASINAGYGTAQVCDIQFQVSGKPATKFSDDVVVPPTPTPGSKWTAYSTVHEAAVNSHNIELDDQGNTYSFIGSTEHSEVTKFSPTGIALWTRRFSSFQTQAELSGVKYTQTIHRISDNLLLCVVSDKINKTHYIGIDASGQVLFNKGYDLGTRSGQLTRFFNFDKSLFLTSQIRNFGDLSINVFNSATGQFLRRFTFSSISGIPPWYVRNAIQRPDGNWIFVVQYDVTPNIGYPLYFIETNAGITSVTRAVRFPDLDVTPTLCYRPDTGGYLILGSTTGRIHYMNDSLELQESRKFLGYGAPSEVLYDANGDYYLWKTSGNWYQDIGVAGGGDGVTLVKYNWNNDIVRYVTTVSGWRDPVVRLNRTLQRMSFAQQAISIAGAAFATIPYRAINSFNIIQPSSTNGSPISTVNPPNFTFFSRTVLNPSPKAVFESLIHTRIEASVSVVSQSNISESQSTFIIEPITRNFNLVSSST